MPLTGQQVKQLHAAILSGFSGSDLEQLAKFELNERLDNVVSTGPLSDIVLQLLEWAERNDRLDDLLRAIQRARPNNKDLQTTVKKLLAPSAVDAKLPSGHAPLDGTRRARLRAILLDQFPTRTALAMLVDDALSVNLNGVARTSNLTETVFELIQWASIDPKGQLLPLLTEAVRQRPNSSELKALKTELFGE